MDGCRPRGYLHSPSTAVVLGGSPAQYGEQVMNEDRTDREPIRRSDRERVLGQRGHVLWFTGLSGAGKTTLACEVERRLNELGLATARLDGDVVRAGLNADLGFSPEDRAENLRRVTEVANILMLSGVIVLVAAISPYAIHRQAARDKVGHDSFTLVHVATPLKVCESRDVKGLYEKARAGELDEFTGVSAPYEVPDSPDVAVATDLSLDETAISVVKALEARGVLRRERAS
jgi:adenylyl-sulfate kinase